MLLQLQLLRLLPPGVNKILRKYVARNAYFCHPDNVLLAMLTDDNDVMREFAVREILAVRGDKEAGEKAPRVFEVPPGELRRHVSVGSDRLAGKRSPADLHSES